MITARLAAIVFTLASFAKPAVAQPSWNDTLAFHDGPFGEMSTLLEKTLFKVDVLVLRVRIDSMAASKLQRFNEMSGFGAATDDSIAQVVMGAHDVLAEIRFLRDVSLSQFLDGIDDDMGKAVRAGLLDQDSHRKIMDDLPASFAFLETRKIRDGDRISYRLHADTLRTVFRDSTGTIMLDQIDVGVDRRQSVLGTFLAPGSSFRKGLLRSVRAPLRR